MRDQRTIRCRHRRRRMLFSHVQRKRKVSLLTQCGLVVPRAAYSHSVRPNLPTAAQSHSILKSSPSLCPSRLHTANFTYLDRASSLLRKMPCPTLKKELRLKSCVRDFPWSFNWEYISCPSSKSQKATALEEGNWFVGPAGSDWRHHSPLQLRKELAFHLG